MLTDVNKKCINLTDENYGNPINLCSTRLHQATDAGVEMMKQCCYVARLDHVAGKNNAAIAHLNVCAKVDTC